MQLVFIAAILQFSLMNILPHNRFTRSYLVPILIIIVLLLYFGVVTILEKRDLSKIEIGISLLICIVAALLNRHRFKNVM